MTRIVPEIGLFDVDDGQGHEEGVDRLHVLGRTKPAARVDGPVWKKSGVVFLSLFFAYLLSTHFPSARLSAANFRADWLLD